MAARTSVFEPSGVMVSNWADEVDGVFALDLGPSRCAEVAT